MSGLDELGRRIEELALGPDAIRAPLARLVRPFVRKRRPIALSAMRLQLLLDECARCPLDAAKLKKALAPARRELRTNLLRVERAALARRAAPVAHAAWLRRLYEVLVRAQALADQPDDLPAARALTEGDAVALLPPLVVEDSPLSNLQLGAVDHLLDAARDERDLLARRRRLLEAARQVLLETSAALPLDPEAVRLRQDAIARDIARCDRLQAAGLDANVGLLHQARSALARDDREKLYAALAALDGMAAARGEPADLALTDRALRQVAGGDPRDPAAAAASLDRSANEVLGAPAVQAVMKGYARHRVRAAKAGKSAEADYLLALKQYLAPGAERATLAAALSVDGCFEVGGVLSPVRVQETFFEVVSVAYPTAHMMLVPARGVEDLPDAVIDDPRAILMQLATGKLLTRRYGKAEPRKRTRTVMQSEARVYVLDGSSSMLGPRARLRDALLVAELATLMRRQAEGGVRVVLFFRYFTRKVGPVTRVDSAEAAAQAIEEVMATPREGGTDIGAALLSSFSDARAQKEADRDLARAQIVLVTDGEAWVDTAVIEAARAGLGGLPLGVSVIALGEENTALRGLVAAQRTAGVRAFYHFVSDADLEALSAGASFHGASVHLPAARRDPLGPDEALALKQDVGALLDELHARERTRDAEALAQLAAGSALPEAAAARVEAAQRDARALERRFRRWFPPPDRRAGAPTPPEPETLERADLDATLLILATVAEVMDVVGGPPLSRQADAVDLVERMLPDAHMTPARWQAIQATYASLLADALQAVHEVVAAVPLAQRGPRPRR